MSIELDENWLVYGTPTDRQRQAFEAMKEHGSYRAAARALDVDPKTVYDYLERLQQKAELRGYSPGADAAGVAPRLYVVKGKSTYYNKDGQKAGQWVKTDLKLEAYLAAVKSAVSEFKEDVPRIDVPAFRFTDFETDIIPWLQIGDAHIGMLAHLAETNDNFDLKIAERELMAAARQLIFDLPPCGRIVINDLGDATHYENMAGVTEASGHALDYDGRFPKMIRAYVRIMRAIVEWSLMRAKDVDVIVNQGNHSRTNDFWMAELLRAAYEHTGRVHVLDNENVFIPYRMGKTLVMVHHSDKCRPKDLVGVMVSDYRKDFGETDFHYIDIGHVHHHFVSKEYPSVVIESWNNLAPNDKWAHDNGYRSRKSMSVVFRSRSYGELGRRLLPLEEVRARILAAQADSTPIVSKRSVYTV